MNTNQNGLVQFNGQHDAKRGTKLWGLNAIRGKILSKMIVDLTALENGFSDDVCKLVRKVIFTLLDELKRLQKEGGPGFQVYRLIAEIEEFDNIYHEWNNIEGEDEFAAQKRRKILEKLKNKRYRIGKIIRNNQGEFHILIDDNLVIVFFNQLGHLLSEYGLYFPSLTKAYSDYRLSPIAV